MTKIVYLPSPMKAVNAISQALLGQLPALSRIFKREAGGQWAALLSASAQIFMYPQFHNYTSSQCPFSKPSDLHVRSSSGFPGSELLGTIEWCIFIFLRNISDEVIKVVF